MRATDLRAIVEPLLAWYEEHKRALPWRNEPTPYIVWVSEIMLQQTRVEAVKGYYERFTAALPTVEDLARCDEERLLKLWEGLGYYSRVRNMQKAAKTIVAEFDGDFPRDVRTLQTLAGVGEYTAGAIASIAFGERAAAVDGNVLRVLARWQKDDTPVNDTRRRTALREELTAVYPPRGEGCAAFTQSLFELGALVCKPKLPDCAACPLRDTCAAYADGVQGEYPVMPQKKAKREEEVYVFVIETPQGICIRRREEGVLRGMNELPSYVRSRGESAEEVLNEWGVYAFTEIARKKYTHVFTHIRWEITCVRVRTESAPFDTYSIEEIAESVSLPTAFRQCLTILNADGRKE